MAHCVRDSLTPRSAVDLQHFKTGPEDNSMSTLVRHRNWTQLQPWPIENTTETCWRHLEEHKQNLCDGGHIARKHSPENELFHLNRLCSVSPMTGLQSLQQFESQQRQVAVRSGTTGILFFINAAMGIGSYIVSWSLCTYYPKCHQVLTTKARLCKECWTATCGAPQVYDARWFSNRLGDQVWSSTLLCKVMSFCNVKVVFWELCRSL